MRHKEKAKIKCVKFQREEQIMQDIIVKINQANEVEEKAKFAQALQKEAEELLSCKGYGPKSLDCKSCYFIAKSRSNTAGLIVKAKELA